DITHAAATEQTPHVIVAPVCAFPHQIRLAARRGSFRRRRAGVHGLRQLTVVADRAQTGTQQAGRAQAVDRVRRESPATRRASKRRARGFVAHVWIRRKSAPRLPVPAWEDIVSGSAGPPIQAAASLTGEASCYISSI